MLLTVKKKQSFIVHNEGRQPMENVALGPNPRVSVIIPGYNTASMIATCLDSFSQTFRDFGAIVVNDVSPDTVQLEDTLQPCQDKIVYIVKPNKLAAGARNTATRAARVEHLAFLERRPLAPRSSLPNSNYLIRTPLWT